MKILRLSSALAPAWTVLLLCLSVTVRSAAQQPAGAPLVGTGAISGVITDATTGAPVEGARAGVMLKPGLWRYMLTDEHGRFVFTDLPPGKFPIDAQKEGFADARNAGDYDGIPLADGEWFRKADIAIVRLGAIEGSVVDERGEPVVGAYVRVMMSFFLAGTPRLAAGPAATTDDRGAYRISGLLPGKYFVLTPSVQNSVPASASAADVEGNPSRSVASIRNGGALVDGQTALILGNYATPPVLIAGRPQAYATLFYPNSPTVANAVPVELKPNGSDVTSVSFTLQPVPVVRVAGRLEDPHANSGLLLRLMPAGLEEAGFGSETATALVNSNGSFTFLNVPAGTYTIVSGQVFEYTLLSPALGLWNGLPEGGGLGELPATPGLGPAAQNSSGSLIPGVTGVGPSVRIGRDIFLPKTVTDDASAFGRIVVNVADRDVTDVVVPRLRPATLHCLVAFEDVPGQLQAGSIQISAANGSAAIGGRTVAKDAAGWAEAAHKPLDIAGLVPGEYVIANLINGFTLKSILVDGQDYSRRTLALSSGQEASAVITLTGKSTVLSGIVRDASGATVHQGSVALFPTDKALWTNQGLTPSWTRGATLSGPGTYRLTNLRAGEYYLIAVDASLATPWRDPTFLESAARVAARVTLNWGDAKAVDLKVTVVPK